ncbi:MAG TPA: abortive phage resistance protein [Ignavibacteriales bacterium]|nr:abortive phage resistance protein [Ignavibacteriales bacterium]
MIETIENTELKRFYQSLNQDLKSTQLATEEGGTLEQFFTQMATDLLAEAGETENVRVSYDEKALGTKLQHKINAYSISDNYETIDLFITIYKGSDDIARVGKDEIETASKRITNFFRKGLLKDYVNEIEESSQIFDFAQTLSNADELRINLVRVNAIILTDGSYLGEIPKTITISDYNIYFRVIDITYLFQIDEKSHLPIEIDFKEDGFDIPCILAPTDNEKYTSYLAIIPGEALANIYERFGSRLLEQNVRSFLQFSGKINKGIRNTIIKEPHMFLAFNNGLAATAEEVTLVNDENGRGIFISKVKDFQIVNGGQTTASIYHTYKKDKGVDIRNIFVQLKLTIIKNTEYYSDIVSRISEYANTQNRVSVADLSSNRPFHISFEKLSRSILTPFDNSTGKKTRWFYERSRGQYRNARLKEGTNSSKAKAFDLTNPKKQVVSKEELAKYINSYQEVYDGKKLIIGPHLVAKGNQKNYIGFLNSLSNDTVDNIYFEDAIAKTILFRSAEKIYGIKPYAIGDMRYITVPYSLSLLGIISDNKLDLYKIWKAQQISQELSELLKQLMILCENFIKETAPGSLYGEWAKKIECWESLKVYIKDFDIDIPEEDKVSKANLKRIRISDSEIDNSFYKEIESTVKSVSPEKWKDIYLYCKENEEIPEYFTIAAHNIGRKLKEGIRPTSKEIIMANELLNKIIFKTPIFDREVESIK